MQTAVKPPPHFYWNGDVLLGEVFHYHTDHLGTPQELSNSEGRIVWQARFKTYGALAVAHVNEVANPLRFQGQYFDEETGLHYNRHRYYDPHSGQFTTQDPIGFADGLPNAQCGPAMTGTACKNPFNMLKSIPLIVSASGLLILDHQFFITQYNLQACF